jgi:outer membrane protein assembly factor BamB
VARRAVALGLAILLAAGIGASSARAGERSSDGDWRSFGHDDQLTNAVDDSTLDAAAIQRLTQAWSATLDGAVVASPLAAVAGTPPRLLVFAATEAGSVYALDARSGSVVWHQTFATVETPGCGSYGFSSTGAIDAARRLLYVAGAAGDVHALSLDSGAEAPGWPVRIIRRTGYAYVYGGLRLVGRTLYVPVASYCDEVDANGLPAEGRLVALNVDDQSHLTFDPVPGRDNLGGIWGWGGVAVEPGGGFLYTGIGNAQAQSDDCQCFDEDAGYADSIVKLSSDLTVVDWDRPDPVVGTPDDDLGAAPLLFQPRGCPPLAAANSKDGRLYLWNRDDLAAGPLLAVPLSDGLNAFVGEPSWSASSSILVDAGATFLSGSKRLGAGLIAYTVQPDCALKPIWSAVLGDGSQPPPLIVADVALGAGGSTGNWEAHALRTGRLLWRFSTGGTPTLAPLIAVDGTIVAATADGTLDAFRPKPAPKTRR